MSAYYQRQDLRHLVSETPEPAQGTALVDSDFTIEMRLSDEQIAENIKRTPYNLCGGEGYTDATDEQKDADMPLKRIATPDSVLWWSYYLLGGGDAFSKTGSADPYTYESRAIQAPDYQLKTFSLVEFFKGGAEKWIYRGGQMATGRVSGSLENKIIQLEGTPEFAGERSAITIADPPECLPEQAYRFNGSTVNFGLYGSGAFSGIKPRGFALTHDNKLETRDECDRNGLYVASRDRGDRSGATVLTYSVLGKKGDAVDQAFHNGSFVFWNISIPNATPSRVWTIGVLRGKIKAKREGWSTSVNKSTHEIDIEIMRDSTSDTTSARWPFWVTVQSGRADFAA